MLGLLLIPKGLIKTSQALLCPGSWPDKTLNVMRLCLLVAATFKLFPHFRTRIYEVCVVIIDETESSDTF